MVIIKNVQEMTTADHSHHMTQESASNSRELHEEGCIMKQLAMIRSRPLHDTAINFQILYLERRSIEVTLSPTVRDRHPSGPLGGVQHRSGRGVIGLDNVPIRCSGLRREIGSSDHIPITNSLPLTICSVFNSHMERGATGVVIFLGASPGRATIRTRAFN
jgi:hypothetical protein